MAEGSSGSGNSAMGLGFVLGFIGLLAGYSANGGGGAVAGAMAGFILGVALVKAVKYGVILLIAAIGLTLAVAAIQRSAGDFGSATSASAAE